MPLIPLIPLISKIQFSVARDVTRFAPNEFGGYAPVAHSTRRCIGQRVPPIRVVHFSCTRPDTRASRRGRTGETCKQNLRTAYQRERGHTKRSSVNQYELENPSCTARALWRPAMDRDAQNKTRPDVSLLGKYSIFWPLGSNLLPLAGCGTGVTE